MADKPANLTKKTLDKDLDKLSFVDDAGKYVRQALVAPGTALIFLGMAMLFAGVYVFGRPDAVLIVAAAAVGGYMAMNIGANDVTNNVGAAVGARAITMRDALIMAAIFEILGATVAGGDVVRTIAAGIVDPATVADGRTFCWIMMAALVAAALWINLATWLNAPVSTTHSIVGAIIGAGISAAGVDTVHWAVIAQIIVSWIVSPLMGGAIAALLLYVVKETIIYRNDKIAAARFWVPILIAIMAGTFATYLTLYVSALHGTSGFDNLAIGIVTGLLMWLLARPLIARQAQGLENRNGELRKLFRLPLVFSAALLSFAHGANDVANAIGPLSAIVHATRTDAVSAPLAVPFWTVIIGAFGIAIGLLLYGPRLIRLVGEQITKLNPMRAYCVSLSSALTVIVATWLGLPVSSTHIAIGAVFGVGFFREWYTRRSARRLALIHRQSGDVEPLDHNDANSDESSRRRLVRRSHLISILAAWTITVPITATLAAILYWGMFALFL